VEDSLLIFSERNLVTAYIIIGNNINMSKLAAALVAALEDEDICPRDVNLQGTDGGKVSASRFLLSARSKVFRKMLFGDFKESTSTVIPLNYSSNTIRRIVRYCYTDEMMEPLESCSEEKVRDMVRLRCAAHFFELEDLEDKIIMVISNHMAKYPSLACAVLDESSAKGEADGVLTEIALGIIGLRAEESLLPADASHEGGVLVLSASVLESILTSQEIAADNFMKYRSLQRWSGETVSDGSQELSCQEQEERSTVAKELAKSIDFHLIQASDLAGMAGSKLVTKDQLYDAFKAHALSAQEEGASGGAAPQVTNGASVLVTGAGLPEVNGKYFEDEKRDGVMSYTKEGLWEGISGKFLLLRGIATINKKRLWFLCWQKGDKIIFFYRSVLNESEMDTIPHNTWMSHDEERRAEPTPRVVFVPAFKDAN
jgi:hypothetical protein